MIGCRKMPGTDRDLVETRKVWDARQNKWAKIINHEELKELSSSILVDLCGAL
jgi:hypothetical protein